MPIDVCLTVDLEFDLGGALGRPEECHPAGAPSVMRMVQNKSEGLGFFLETLAQHGLPATFFVEVFQSCHFGTGEMTSVVETIRRSGAHDFQLHTHPIWRELAHKDWRSNTSNIQLNDSFLGLENLRPILAEAIELFRQICGQPATTLRPGNLHVDMQVLRQAAELGLQGSSSVGLGYWMPKEAPLHIFNGTGHVGNLLEVPVATYHEIWPFSRKPKILTITGSSWPTLEGYLRWASRKLSTPVVLLTHASEFAEVVHRAPNGEITYRASSYNQAKLRRLCHYLASQPDKFRVTTFRKGLDQWKSMPAEQLPPYQAPLISAAARWFGNKYYRI